MDKEIQNLKNQIKTLKAHNEQWESEYAALNEQHLRIMKAYKRWKEGFIRLNDKCKAEKLNQEQLKNPYLIHFFTHN